VLYGCLRAMASWFRPKMKLDPKAMTEFEAVGV